MSRKVKVLISVLVAILLLGMLATAPVMAQEGTTPPPKPSVTKGLLSRIAEILNIPEENLLNAFKQARQEMREEVFDKALEKAVEKGLITPEQGKEIKTWWENKPEVLKQGMLRRFFNFWRQRFGQHRGNHKGWQVLKPSVEAQSRPLVSVSRSGAFI